MQQAKNVGVVFWDFRPRAVGFYDNYKLER